MGSSRKAKARRKTTHTKVKVGLKKEKRPPGAVLLPGTQQATAWAQDTTLRRNYRALGLAQDPNPGFGRVNPQQPPAEEGETAGQDAEPTLGQLAHCDPDALRVATGQHLPKGQRPPKKLTNMQLSIVGALVEAHGDDVAAMARDMKRNAMQHSAGVLRVLVDAYNARGGPEALQFRAPMKRLC